MGAAVRATAEINDQARSPAPGAEFADCVLAAVHSIVRFDGYCLLGLDPVSGLRSFMFSKHGLNDSRRLAYNEFVERDVNRYADLGAATNPVGVLSFGAARAPSSPRLHEILRPAGFGSELRLALRSNGMVFGALVLFREDGRRPFTEAEASLANGLAACLSTAVRRYPVRTVTASLEVLPAGVVVLDANNYVQHCTDEAAAWLDDLRAGDGDDLQVDDVLRVVYDVANATRRSLANDRSATTRCVTRTTSGRWLAVEGSCWEPDAAEVAVTLHAATLAEVLAEAAAGYGLTPRETDVFKLLSRGLPAKQMARRLQLSPMTVNDHLRAVYRKAHVCGREALLAQLT